MKKLILIIFTTFSLSVFADHHESAPMTTDGAFTTLMIAATDINKYTETLRENPSAFQATGTTGAGVCVTNSGKFLHWPNDGLERLSRCCDSFNRRY